MNDTDLAEHLARALHDTLDGEHVDLPRLMQGTRQRARRARTARRSGLAVACTAAVGGAAVVPIALAGFRGGDAAGTRTGTVSPTTATSPPASAASSPDPSYGTGPDPARTGEEVAYPVPNGVAFTRSDLPSPMVLLSDSGQSKKLPTVMGQSCQDPAIKGATPVAGRNWHWAEEDSNRPQLSVELLVTGWASGTGHRRFEDVVRDRGMCRWAVVPTPVDTGRMRGDDVWAAARTAQGTTAAYALVRVGDVLVAVSVMDPGDRQSAVALAQRLATLAAVRVRQGRVGLADQPSAPSQPVPSATSNPYFPTVAAYTIPDSAMLQDGDLPRGLRAGFELPDEPAIPVVMDAQACGAASATRPLPVAGRSREYKQRDTVSLRQITVTYTVTGWAKGTGPARFADVVADRGTCRWLRGTPRPVSTSGTVGDDLWVATTVDHEPGSETTVPVGLAVVRVGDQLVGLRVTDPAGAKAVVDLAERLATTAAARVRAAGLP